MLIITVETSAAKVNFLLDGPLAGPAAGELARSWLAKALVDEIHSTSEVASRSAMLHVEGTLRAPVDVVLRSRVESLLQGGVRRVVLDLSGVSDIDAAGVGELIHIFNTAAAAGGAVEIAQANPHVHRVLDVAGVFGLLCHEDGREKV